VKAGRRSGRRRRSQRVEVAGGVTTEKNRSRAKILDGETKGVKLNRNGIITSKGAYRNQIFYQIRRNKDIVKFESRKGCGNGGMTFGMDRERSPVPDNDVRRRRWGMH
jgi:hypothetical protein